MQDFLDFWTRYNVHIINWLLVAVFVLVGFVIYFISFGTQTHPEGGSAISPDLENTLKKILDQQVSGKGTGSSLGESKEGESSGSEGSSSPAVAELQAQLAEKEKQIQEIKEKATAQASGSTAGGNDDSQLQERIQELESRLSEYEIIAEDIADLSFYKEENQKLQKEIDEHKKGGFVAAAAPALAPTIDPAPASVLSTPEPLPPEPVKAPEPAPAMTATPVAAVPVQEKITPESSAPTAEVAAPPLDDTDVTNELVGAPIDDDLMKEFAAAVESQKATSQSEAAPSEPATSLDTTAVEAVQAVPPDTDENAKLLNQFEDFVKKS